MIPPTADLAEVTRMVFESTLGSELLPAGPTPSAPDAQRWLVDISGPTPARVWLDVPDQLAKTAAAVMLGICFDDANADDAGEAIAELTNMIGGNIKGLMPGPSHLSLPRPMPEPGTSHHTLWFGWRGGVFSLHVTERQ